MDSSGSVNVFWKEVKGWFGVFFGNCDWVKWGIIFLLDIEVKYVFVCIDFVLVDDVVVVNINVCIWKNKSGEY